VRDLKLPQGVEVLDDPDNTIATVGAPKAEEVAAPAAEGAVAADAVAEPELIRKAKADEDEEEEK
jgi:hypothetical protein